MIDSMPIVPDCMSDQGKRFNLLDDLVALYDDVADLCVLLLTLEHGGLDHANHDATLLALYMRATDVLVDWATVGPRVGDLAKVAND